MRTRNPKPKGPKGPKALSSLAGFFRHFHPRLRRLGDFNECWPPSSPKRLTILCYSISCSTVPSHPMPYAILYCNINHLYIYFNKPSTIECVLLGVVNVCPLRTRTSGKFDPILVVVHPCRSDRAYQRMYIPLFESRHILCPCCLLPIDFKYS